MSRYHRINWRESDNEELKRVVRNYNAKLSRIAKKNPQIKNVLPDKVSVAQLKELINTRQDLKRELNSLKRFSKRGSEEIVTVPDTDYNLKITKWQKSEMNRRVAVINRRRKKRLEDLQELEMSSSGEKLGYKKGDFGMGKATEISLSPMNAFTRRMNQADLKMKWEGILRQSQSDYFTQKDFRLRNNYIKALEQNYNSNDIQDIIDTINHMDIKDFLNKFEEEGGNMEFAYPPNQEQYNAYVNGLRATWNPNR